MAKLRAAECREFMSAVAEKADAMGVPVSIAVVGAEGHLIAVERMDKPASSRRRRPSPRLLPSRPFAR